MRTTFTHLHRSPAPVRRFLPELINLIWQRRVDPGKAFDLTLPFNTSVPRSPEPCHELLGHHPVIEAVEVAPGCGDVSQRELCAVYGLLPVSVFRDRRSR